MKSILVVDDNTDILESINQGLSRRLKDCRILTALNGETGERLLRTERVDLVLTDLEMPVMDGYRFIECVRHALPSVPVCVMLGSCPAGVVERLRMLGVTRIIGKPFLLDRLVDVIAEELNPVAGRSFPGVSGSA